MGKFTHVPVDKIRGDRIVQWFAVPAPRPTQWGDEFAGVGGDAVLIFEVRKPLADQVDLAWLCERDPDLMLTIFERKRRALVGW